MRSTGFGVNATEGHQMLTRCLGEFMGTLVLIFLGDGVVANILLKRSKAEGAGWMVIATGWAFAVMAGVFTAIACGSSMRISIQQ
jgi:glycerol uptake facilitator protein